MLASDGASAASLSSELYVLASVGASVASLFNELYMLPSVCSNAASLSSFLTLEPLAVAVSGLMINYIHQQGHQAGLEQEVVSGFYMLALMELIIVFY